MVLQNPLPFQVLVATTPPFQPNPNALGPPPMAETGVHHLLAMTTEEVNLQTRRNQYGTTTEPADSSAASMSKTINLPLQLPPFLCPLIHYAPMHHQILDGHQNLEGDGLWHVWFPVLCVKGDQLGFGGVYYPQGG